MQLGLRLPALLFLGSCVLHPPLDAFFSIEDDREDRRQDDRDYDRRDDREDDRY